MFYTRKKQAELETFIKDEQQKCVRQINLMIQSLREELNDVIEYFKVVEDDSPSKRAETYLQRLDDYQSQMDAMAGSVIDGPLPEPPRRNG